jgi:hypothetical protein
MGVVILLAAFVTYRLWVSRGKTEGKEKSAPPEG